MNNHPLKKENRKVSFCIELLGMPGAGKTTCVQLISTCFPSLRLRIHNNDCAENAELQDKVQFNKRVAEMLNAAVSELGSDKLVVFDRGLTDAEIWLRIHAALEKNEERKALFKHIEDTLPSLSPDLRLYRILFLHSMDTTKSRRAKPRHAADVWAITDDCLSLMHYYYNELLQKAENDERTYIIHSGALSLDEMKETFIGILHRIAEKENLHFSRPEH